MVLDALREQCELVAQAKMRYQNLAEERNELMCELKAAGVPGSRLVQISGLSMSMVSKITAGARRAAGENLETRRSAARLQRRSF